MNQAWLQWLHVSEQSWFKEVDKQYQNHKINNALYKLVQGMI
jgi:hypothetical protein